MAKRKTGNTQESLISTNVGVLSGQRAPEAFSRGAGIREYGSWIAAASDMNAKAVASNPLRLFARKRSGAKMLFPVRDVSRKRKQYLLGDAKRLPSVNTVRKAMEVGEDFVEVMDHPIMDLIYRVNSWMCGFDLLVQTETFKQTAGNAYWYKVPGKFGVEAIWPLPPQYTYVLPDRGRYIGGYEYRPPNSGEAIRFDADEVIHFRLPNPRSQWYGMGNVERCWLATLSNRARHEMDVAFYDNYGRPDIIWIIKNTSAKQDELDAFTASMEQRLKGRRKTGKHIAVTGEIETKNLQFAPKEMANETPTIEEIAACFGIPVSMLMANDPNLASATVGYSWWREQTIAPLCRMTEDVLNQNLLPDFGIEGDAYLAFDDPVPENEKEEYDTRRTLVAGGIMTINEAREEDGDDPHPNPLADELLFNGQPIGAATAMPQVDAAKPDAAVPDAKPVDATRATATAAVAGDPNAAVQDTALNGAQVTALVDLVSQARADTIPVDTAQAIASAAFPLMTPEELAAIFNPVRSAPPLPTPEPVKPVADQVPTATKHAHGKHCKQSEQRFAKGSYDDTKRNEEDEKVLRDFMAALDSVGRKQAEAIVAKMTKLSANPRAMLAAVQLEASQAQWVREIAASVKPYIGEQVRAGGSVGAAILDIPEFGFDFANHEVSKWIDKATARIANDVNGTTVYRVRDLVGDGIEKGETIDELSKRVMQSGATIDPARAEMIARTESAKAYGQGQLEAWKQSGVVSHKKWFLAPDACFAAGSQVVKIENGTKASVGIETLRPGDYVMGASGIARRVLGIKSKMHVGDVVVGRGFVCTPDHRFLTSSGWMPIGQYASKTLSRSLVEFLVGEAKNIPSAFAKVVGLSPVLCGDFGSGVPIHSVTQDYEIPRANHEVNDPSFIHGDLLGEFNRVVPEQIGHDDFYVGSALVGVNGDDVAISRTVVAHESDLGCDSTRILEERLSAGSAGASDLLLAGRVCRSAHPLGVCCTGAGSSAELCVTTSGVPVLGLKRFAATVTAAFRESWHVSRSPSRGMLAGAAAILRGSFSSAVNGLKRLSAQFALECSHESIVTRLVQVSNSFRGLVYDIEVEDEHSFTLSCGLIAHNCEFCRSIAREFNANPVPLDHPFKKLGETIQGVSGGTFAVDYENIDGAPLHPGCRCDVIPVLEIQ